MKSVIWVVVLWAMGATAAAPVTYIDERFNNGCPPPGWTTQDNGRGHFYPGSSGPYGSYAYAYSTVSSMTSPGWAYLESTSFNIVQGQTLYYRFQYDFYRSPSLGSAWGAFYIVVPVSGQILTSWSRNTTSGDWTEMSGTYVPPYNATVAARWRLDVAVSSMGGQTGRFSIDTCQIGTDDFAAVAPASLGRVKAVFR
jgi:hypothetical protein